MDIRSMEAEKAEALQRFFDHEDVAIWYASRGRRADYPSPVDYGLTEAEVKDGAAKQAELLNTLKEQATPQVERKRKRNRDLE